MTVAYSHFRSSTADCKRLRSVVHDGEVIENAIICAPGSGRLALQPLNVVVPKTADNSSVMPNRQPVGVLRLTVFVRPVDFRTTIRAAGSSRVRNCDGSGYIFNHSLYD